MGLGSYVPQRLHGRAVVRRVGDREGTGGRLVQAAQPGGGRILQHPVSRRGGAERVGAAQQARGQRSGPGGAGTPRGNSHFGPVPLTSEPIACCAHLAFWSKSAITAVFCPFRDFSLCRRSMLLNQTKIRKRSRHKMDSKGERTPMVILHSEFSETDDKISVRFGRACKSLRRSVRETTGKKGPKFSTFG